MPLDQLMRSLVKIEREKAVVVASRILLERLDRMNAQRLTRYGPNRPAIEGLRAALAALDGGERATKGNDT